VLTSDVVLTLNYPAPKFVGGIYAEILSIIGTTGAEACNSDPAPSGLGNVDGLWSYGTVNQSLKTSTRTWNFKVPSTVRTTFTGRIVGVVGDTYVAPTPLPTPVVNYSPTIAHARNGMVYATSDSPNLAYVGLDGSYQGLSLDLPAFANAVATYIGPTPADDLTWFTTDVDVDNLAYVGVVTGDGTVYSIESGAGTIPLLNDLVIDATSPTNRAWFVSISSGYINNVTLNPGPPRLTLGTPIPLVQPQYIAFGPPPQQHIFVTSYWGNTLTAYSAVDGSLVGSYPTPTACNGPAQVVLGPDDKLWFTQFGQFGGVCNMDAAGTTFTRVTSSPNPQGLAVSRSATGTGSAVWVTDFAKLSVTELVEGESAFISIVLPTGSALNTIAASPAVAGPPAHPAYIWAATDAGLHRLQPAAP
jgi:hypothetical protein